MAIGADAVAIGIASTAQSSSDVTALRRACARSSGRAEDGIQQVTRVVDLALFGARQVAQRRKRHREREAEGDGEDEHKQRRESGGRGAHGEDWCSSEMKR